MFIKLIELISAGLFYPAIVETVFEWPNTGRYHWILIKNVILMVTAVFALITGSLVSIEDIIRMYTTGNTM